MPSKKRSAPADFSNIEPRATRQRVKAAGTVLAPVNTTPPDIRRRTRRGAPRPTQTQAPGTSNIFSVRSSINANQAVQPPANDAGDDASHPTLGRTESPAASTTEGPLPPCQGCLDRDAEKAALRVEFDKALEKIEALEADRDHWKSMALKPKSPVLKSKSPDQEPTPASEPKTTINSEQQAPPTIFGRIKRLFSPRPAAPATVPTKRTADFTIDSSPNALPETPSRPPKRARLASASPDIPRQQHLAPFSNTMQATTPVNQSEAVTSSHNHPNQEEHVSAIHNNNTNAATKAVNPNQIAEGSQNQSRQQYLSGLIGNDNRLFLSTSMLRDSADEDRRGPQIFDPGVPREWYNKLPMCTRALHIDQVTGKFTYAIGHNRKEKIREEIERQYRLKSARDQGLVAPETEEERFIREEAQRAYAALIKTYGENWEKRDRYCAHQHNQTFEQRIRRVRGGMPNAARGFGMPVLPEPRGFLVHTPEPEAPTTPTPTNDAVAQEQNEQSVTGGQSTYAAPDDEPNEGVDEEPTMPEASMPTKKKKEKKTDFSTYKYPSSDEEDSEDEDDDEDITMADASPASTSAANTSTSWSGPVLTAEAIRWEKEKQAKRDEFERFRADRDAERLRLGYQPSSQAESDEIYQSDLAAFNEILIERREAKKRELEEKRRQPDFSIFRAFPDPLKNKPSVAKASEAAAATPSATTTPAAGAPSNTTSQETSTNVPIPTTSTVQDAPASSGSTASVSTTQEDSSATSLHTTTAQHDAGTSSTSSAVESTVASTTAPAAPKTPKIKNLEEKLAIQRAIFTANQAAASQPTSTPPPVATTGVGQELSAQSTLENNFQPGTAIKDSRSEQSISTSSSAAMPSSVSTTNGLQSPGVSNSADAGDWQQAQLQRKMQELDRYKPKASSSLRNVSRLSSSTVASNDVDESILQATPNGIVKSPPTLNHAIQQPVLNGTPSQSELSSTAIGTSAPSVGPNSTDQSNPFSVIDRMPQPDTSAMSDAARNIIQLIENDPRAYFVKAYGGEEAWRAANPFLSVIDSTPQPDTSHMSDAVRDPVTQLLGDNPRAYFIKAAGGQKAWDESVRTVFGI